MFDGCMLVFISDETLLYVYEFDVTNRDPNKQKKKKKPDMYV
jgi:hypothetical protein